MMLSWGPLTFNLLRVTDYVTQITYTEDMTTYLWDHIGIRCLCMLTPQVNSLPPGASPAVTFATILPILKRQRQTLRVWQQDDPANAAAQNVVLLSPLINATTGRPYTTDANNGPRCVVHGLDTFHGNGGMWFDLEFSTDINMCQGTQSKPPALILSNRYEMRVTYDNVTYRPSYEYEGKAVFRTDVLRAGGAGGAGPGGAFVPDQFRGGLIPPVFIGYQRHPIRVAQNEGNSGLEYLVVDRYMAKSQPMNYNFQVAEMFINEIRGYTSNLAVPSIITKIIKGGGNIIRSLRGLPSQKESE